MGFLAEHMVKRRLDQGEIPPQEPCLSFGRMPRPTLRSCWMRVGGVPGKHDIVVGIDQPMNRHLPECTHIGMSRPFERSPINWFRLKSKFAAILAAMAPCGSYPTIFMPPSIAPST